jgi:hypothetical protein
LGNGNLAELDLPPEIIAFFEARQPARDPFWKRTNLTDKDKTALDLDPEVVIQYLETSVTT